ncbi:MAG: hypothetical protein PHT76_10445 [Anaerostipes sp.]|nr:hypothetical protein [Anaerostipes sp.]
MDKITLKVKECSEFETLGECHENIESVSEAVRLRKKIPAERTWYQVDCGGIGIARKYCGWF